MSSKYKKISSYLASSRSQTIRSKSNRELGENEDLIGVYGVKDRENWITTFGFIVKVNIE